MDPTDHLPLLNRDVAIARLLKDRTLYLALLRQFRQMHEHDIDKIEATLRTGAPNQLHKLVHGLRGAASIVGAERLSAIASALLKPGGSADPTLQNRLCSVFALTWTAVGRELGDPE